MRGSLDTIRGKGVDLVVVGNGQPFHALAFRDEFKLDFPVLVDPELVAYHAAGLKRGVASTLGPAAVWHGIRAMLDGHRPQQLQGDAWQQGGVFVISPSGKVPYAYISRAGGDHPPVADILAALDRC